MWACACFREWRWFLTRIRPTEFSALRPPSRQYRPDYPVWTQANSGQTGENPPYKGGWWKIGYHQEERDEPEFPRLALRWPHPCSLPIEWGSRGCPPNINLRPRVVLDAQVLLPARDGDERNHSPSSGVMINSRGERMTKALERTEEKYNRFWAQLGWRSQRI